MSSPALETFLARLYTDAELRQRFLQQPQMVALQAGLSTAEAQALEQIDRIGLQMAAHSFAAKRAGRVATRSRWQRVRRRISQRLSALLNAIGIQR
ncbi:MAG: hypothetical protein HYZ45_12340 [Burkholderiales bacterium]|nr:hypothetical protein [Burkholderiales bacterium]